MSPVAPRQSVRHRIAVRSKPERIPGATYRLQFNEGFTLAQAVEVVEYLKHLGITDAYASPLFQATPGSTHGYDICAFDEVQSALGGAGQFTRFCERLRLFSMGLLLDMVPNHMGSHLCNPAWRDVLQHGPGSAFSRWFAVHWDAPGAGGKVLLPLLEDHYVNVLEAGKIRLSHENGEWALTYRDWHFPLSPESVRSLAGEPAELVARLNGQPGNPSSFDQLDQLLEAQNYRLCYWRTGLQRINYRRFFDVSELVSLRMELPEVFAATHELLLSWVKAGRVTGVRVDHPDGLWDPREYFERLEENCAPRRPYVVAEKILTGTEPLPPDWPLEGTTGYDFLNELNGLFINSAQAEVFTNLYGKISGDTSTFQARVLSAKKQALDTMFVGELDALARELGVLAAHTRRGRDFTSRQLRAALREILAALPVYRTYVTETTSELRAEEAAYLGTAVRRAQETADKQGARARESLLPNGESSALDPAACELVGSILTLRLPPDLKEVPSGGEGEVVPAALACRRFVMKVQQLSGPAMAKGAEDTAFYNYNRFVSLNEVGGDPGRFGLSLEEFHQRNAARARDWPHSLLATATHDTKRGEDVRARLNVLSEMPREWSKAVERWRGMNSGFRSGSGPSPNDEYLLYQTLIGAWPVETNAGPGLSAFRERVWAYMLKAMKEAKVETSWTSPNAEYERSTQLFVERALSGPNPFLEDLLPFQQHVAFFGRFNSLSQVLLKMTCPGVPDFYQGCEMWDFNLVDPDNRRPVDYDLRREVLAWCKATAPSELARACGFVNRAEASRHEAVKPFDNFVQAGAAKLFLISRALWFRQAHREMFDEGEYLPLTARGRRAEHCCAFARIHGHELTVVLVPRLVFGLSGGKRRAPIGREVWEDTSVVLPAAFENASFHDVVMDEPVANAKGEIHVAEALSKFPVALLETPVPRKLE